MIPSIDSPRTLLREQAFVLVCSLLIVAPGPAYAQAVILTSDQQLSDLQDPDKTVDLSTGHTPTLTTLRRICAEAKEHNANVLTIAFDEFFRQYREDAGTERKLTPDQDEYITKLKTVSDFAKGYGLGLSLSLLNPLEIGPGFVRATGESGRWVHLAVGLRDPGTGKFSIQLWQQLSWTNNKGKISLKMMGVRAFAFKEHEIEEGQYSVVRPEDIHELTSGIAIDRWDTTSMVPKWEPSSLASDVRLPMQRVRVYSNGDTARHGFDRVFVMLEYETPEMDYFSPVAAPFLHQLLEKYADAGINLAGLYSDEMHIQQDWYYYNHHDEGQFRVRYLTKNLAREYARRFGSEFREMQKHMLYFVYGPKYYLNSPRAVLHTQYVMGERPEDVQRTVLFRHRYYRLLGNAVVDLFTEAKAYAEALFGRELATQAHASWAESPTIDLWNTGALKQEPYQYEYTPNFLWSNTVQQASAACDDYFKWGEYLRPTGNDFAECGWADRNYFGAAMAVSVGILNRYPNAYAAFWGLPRACEERKRAVNSAFGAGATPILEAILERQHRDVDVLVLYPLTLVAAEERFGGWVTQYAYANYITPQKLLEVGRISDDGRIVIGNRRFSTLVSLFEMVPEAGLLDLMDTFIGRGGKLVWFGPPPLIDGEAKTCLDHWEKIFGVNYTPTLSQGEIAPGKKIVFTKTFAAIPEQIILTDFLVDRVYPVTLGPQCVQLAVLDGLTIGTGRAAGRGYAYFMGFRPRDDQASSLGYETRTLFEILNAVGAYPPTGVFPGINDNTEFLSRTGPYLATRFPNGATVIAAHYRTHRESWQDGFARNDSLDAIALSQNPLPSDRIDLREFKVNGHSISYSGRLIVAFNVDTEGALKSFEGHDCNQIVIDGDVYPFSRQRVKSLAWAPPTGDEEARYEAFLKFRVDGAGALTLPLPRGVRSVRFAQKVGNNRVILENLRGRVGHDRVTFTVTPDCRDRWVYICR